MDQIPHSPNCQWATYPATPERNLMLPDTSVELPIKCVFYDQL